MTTPPNPSWPPEQERNITTPGTSHSGVPPAQPPYPGAYGHQGYAGYPIQPPTNGFAIASLVLGIFIILWGIPSILALIFGYIARRQIRERNEGGDGLAVAGIVLGWVGVGLWTIFLIFVVIGASFGG
jgi:hypothetical protein